MEREHDAPEVDIRSVNIVDPFENGEVQGDPMIVFILRIRFVRFEFATKSPRSTDPAYGSAILTPINPPPL